MLLPPADQRSGKDQHNVAVLEQFIPGILQNGRESWIRLDEIRKLVNYQYLFLLRFTDFKKEDRLVNLPLYAVEQIVDL